MIIEKFLDNNNDSDSDDADDGIQLTTMQKKVLRLINDIPNSKIAAEELTKSDDKENMNAAADLLHKYGYIERSDTDVTLTDKGQWAIDDYDIANDPELAMSTKPPEGVGGTPTEPSYDELGLESVHLLSIINKNLLLFENFKS